MGSERAAALAASLGAAADDLLALLERIDQHRWQLVPEPGVWSIGKDADHVAEAAVYHHWIVRLTIGERVSSRRPAIERSQMTSPRSQSEALELIRRRTRDGQRLLAELTDEQLAMETRPPRARGQILADTVERVLIAHYRAHQADVEAKLTGRG